MYWLRTGNPAELLPLLAAACAWVLGGWLLATHAFHLLPRERVVAGAGIGLGGYLFFANLLGHVLQPGAAFWLSSLMILGSGAALAWRTPWRRLPWNDWRAAFPQLLAIVLVAVFVTLVGRGVGFFDDRKNLSLISSLAAGDIPPHFYMNPAVLFRYHYALQLLGASLMRLGGFFPWSAFDLAKGLTAGLALALAGLVGWRWTHNPWGGLAAAVTLAFASGARWLLLFLPTSFLRVVGTEIDLAGSGAASATSLLTALRGAWSIGGGPPASLPFAFVNGVLQPFDLSSQAGPASLARALVLLLILLLPRVRRWPGMATLAFLFACLALAWETDYLLLAAGLVIATLWSAILGTPRATRWPLILGTAAALLGGALALFQGGTLTELARSAAAGLTASGPAAGFGANSLALRWPPAIVSAHLGELPLHRPGLLLVGLLELGAGILAAPLVGARLGHWARKGRFEFAALGAAAWLGFLLPLFLRYEVDRDISRFTAFSLTFWPLLGGLVAWQWVRSRRSGTGRLALLTWWAILLFGGVVTLGPLMTAWTQTVVGDDLSPLDARMTAAYWDSLPQQSIVFDSHPWRAVVVTGRLVRSSSPDYLPLPDWEDLVERGTPSGMVAAGYDFVYADRQWWLGLSPEQQAAFGEPCVQQVGTMLDEGNNGTRTLFDIRSCR